MPEAVLGTTYHGYLNYYIIGGRDRNLKSYNFSGLTKAEVNKLVEQFSDPKLYDYKGIKKIKDTKKEKR